jgi:CRP/FNR family transcriptional regulator, cyclic AMP receptor protein
VQSGQHAARAGYSACCGLHSVNHMTSPVAAALTPVLIPVTLWLETASLICITRGKKRAKKKASSAKVLTATDSAATKLHARPCRPLGQGQREDPKSSDVHQALVASGIFSRTNPDTASALSGQLKSQRFALGRAVGAENDFGDRLYVIISGKVKVAHRRPGGCEMVLAILGPSEIFGAVALFDPETPKTRVTPLTEVLAVPIERNQLLGWMAERPEVRDQVLRLFARWAKATRISLGEFAFADVASRVASQLLQLNRRFGCREGEVVRVVHDMTLEDFALLVGDAQETVAATLRHFADRGWIRLEGNSVVIVDAPALRSVQQTSISEFSRV